jgi:predicted secreted protein
VVIWPTLTPIRNVPDARGSDPVGLRHAADEHSTTEASAPTAPMKRPRLVRAVLAVIIYRLFNGTSSTMAQQYPCGLTLVAFFTMVIFIVVS